MNHTTKQKIQSTTRSESIAKHDGIEITEGHHPLEDFSKVKNNLKNVSLDEISIQLDYYNGDPVIVDGTVFHPFNDPLTAARFNARYFELTGENHPTFVEQAPKVIDNLLKDAPKLIQEGVYPASYFEKILRIKNNITNEQEQENENQQISDKRKQLQIARESISQSYENINDCKCRCDKTVDDITEDRNLIEKNNKQSIFARLFSKVKDRIGGKENFSKNVIEPIKNKASYIKSDVLPNVKDKIQYEVMPKLKAFMEKGKEKEKVNEMDLKERFQTLLKMMIQKDKNDTLYIIT